MNWIQKLKPIATWNADRKKAELELASAKEELEERQKQLFMLEFRQLEEQFLINQSLEWWTKHTIEMNKPDRLSYVISVRDAASEYALRRIYANEWLTQDESDRNNRLAKEGLTPEEEAELGRLAIDAGAYDAS